VSVARQVQSFSGHLSFQAPTVSSISPNFTPSSGSSYITVAGASAGLVRILLAHRATVGSTDCASTTWLSDTAVETKIVHVIGPDLSVIVTVASQTAHLTNQFSSSAPIVSSTQPISHSTVGGSILSLFGQNLGPFSVVPTAKLGSTVVTNRFYTSDSLCFLGSSSWCRWFYICKNHCAGPICPFRVELQLLQAICVFIFTNIQSI
jgi:hypothetical protein